MLAPTSGYVTLRTPNPRSAPRILHNYLQSDDDRASLLAGIRTTLQIARQGPLADVSTGTFVIPDDESDVGLLAFAARTGMTLYHPTSTCAIGPVVDAELRVHGFANLRVVDASVLPSVPPGNTNAPPRSWWQRRRLICCGDARRGRSGQAGGWAPKPASRALTMAADRSAPKILWTPTHRIVGESGEQASKGSWGRADDGDAPGA